MTARNVDAWRAAARRLDPRKAWVLALTLAAACTADPPTASVPSEPGRPDLNGIYFPAGFARRTPQQLPYTEGAAAMAEYWEANFRTEDEPGRFCIWPGMPRAPGGAPGTGGHTNLDFYDTIQAEDLMKNAVVMASYAWHAAMSDAKMPRKAAVAR